ncbi:hydroxymethylbilane synthase [Rhizobium sp. P40RR-XXII]|uniref:hydroxymethylbilane synthase n=1 Tax=Rhizobium sp. P40RR-XXII TaxID=2726739 RepID=UPI0014574F0C|nr:hydroxymethylbilane synthase [Rhizobium sp. P40RR-XXII]NLS19984.1 hydroxymethylbilane synthase [Rhizobium sp. P40RR-XXII]
MTVRVRLSGAKPIKIGTRASPLARAQASEVAARLAACHGLPPEAFIIVSLTTKGDQLREQPLPDIGVKGLFTQELEERLLSGEIDLAVHSCKDVATVLPRGLHISACLPREDVRDAFISRTGCRLWELPPGAVVGTSSIRRQALLALHRPDLVVVPFRGLVGTRLQKLESGVVDATLLAQAGLNRLGLGQLATEILNLSDFPPAPAQGAICIESSVANSLVTELVSVLDHEATADAVRCERSFLRSLDGSCRTPIAAHATCHGSELVLCGMTIEPDGSHQRTVVFRGRRSAAEAVGGSAARLLISNEAVSLRSRTGVVGLSRS